MRKTLNRLFTFLSVLWLIQGTNSAANSNCSLLVENERLTNHCLLETVNGKLVDRATMQVLVSKLQREGYFGGIPQTQLSGSIVPDAYYSNNMNGGNPKKPLIIGGMEFTTDKEFEAKAGWMIGMNSSVNLRKSYSVGRYIDANANLIYAKSLSDDLSTRSGAVSICSKNLLTEKLYADFCASHSTTTKELTHERNSYVLASIAKLDAMHFNAPHEVNASIMHLKNNEYSQNQVHINVDTIHNDSLASSFTIKKGEQISDELSMDHGISYNITGLYGKRAYTVGFDYQYSDGGTILGQSRSDVSTGIFVSTKLDASTKITLGYFKRNSSINYYDEAYPTIRLTRSLWYK